MKASDVTGRFQPWALYSRRQGPNTHWTVSSGYPYPVWS